MAGCSLIFLFLIGMPILIAVAVIFLGSAFGSVLIAIVSTAVYIYLWKNEFFTRYKDSENALGRYAPGIIRILLIIAMVLSWIFTMGFAYLIFIYR